MAKHFILFYYTIWYKCKYKCNLLAVTEKVVTVLSSILNKKKCSYSPIDGDTGTELLVCKHVSRKQFVVGEFQGDFVSDLGEFLRETVFEGWSYLVEEQFGILIDYVVANRSQAAAPKQIA